VTVWVISLLAANFSLRSASFSLAPSTQLAGRRQFFGKAARAPTKGAGNFSDAEQGISATYQGISRPIRRGF